MVVVLSRNKKDGTREVYVRYADRSELTVVEAFMLLGREFTVAYWRMHGDIVWVLVTINYSAFFLYKCTNGKSRFIRRFLLDDLPAPVEGGRKRQYLSTFGHFEFYKVGRDDNGPIFAASHVSSILNVYIEQTRYGPFIYVNYFEISPPRGTEFKLIGYKNVDGCGYLLILAREHKKYKLTWSAILKYSYADDKWNEEYTLDGWRQPDSSKWLEL